MVDDFAQNQKSLYVFTRVLCSFPEELDVIMILEDIDDIGSNVELCLSNGRVDNRQLHQYWCQIHIISYKYWALIGDESLLNWTCCLNWILKCILILILNFSHYLCSSLFSPVLFESLFDFGIQWSQLDVVRILHKLMSP